MMTDGSSRERPVNLEDQKIWVDELDCFVIRYETVLQYLSEMKSFESKLEEARNLIKLSTQQLNDAVKDLKG